MPLNQRQVIAEAIEGKRYVEWGVGGSSNWMIVNASPSFAISIDHDARWVEQFESGYAYSSRVAVEKKPWAVRYVLCSPGPNATIGEEQAPDAEAYIAAGVLARADVYLIDGVVRGRCLEALVETGRPMTIFLHDTQRDWYDWAIDKAIAAGFVRTDYPEGDDYPGCLLTKITKE